MVEFLVYACAAGIVLLAIGLGVMIFRLAVCDQGIGDLHRRLRAVERTIERQPWRESGVRIVTETPRDVAERIHSYGLPPVAATAEDLRVGDDERELWRPWRDVGGG